MMLSFSSAVSIAFFSERIGWVGPTIIVLLKTGVSKKDSTMVKKYCIGHSSFPDKSFQFRIWPVLPALNFSAASLAEKAAAWLPMGLFIAGAITKNVLFISRKSFSFSKLITTVCRMSFSVTVPDLMNRDRQTTSSNLKIFPLVVIN